MIKSYRFNILNFLYLNNLLIICYVLKEFTFDNYGIFECFGSFKKLLSLVVIYETDFFFIREYSKYF